MPHPITLNSYSPSNIPCMIRCQRLSLNPDGPLRYRRLPDHGERQLMP